MVSAAHQRQSAKDMQRLEALLKEQRESPAERLRVFNDARAMQAESPDLPDLVLNQLLHVYEGRTWMDAGFFGSRSRYYFNIAGVSGWAADRTEDGARDALRRWIESCRQAIRKDREARQNA